MPDTNAHLSSTDLLGTWNGEVRFTAGPLKGDIHPDAWLLADDGILVQLRSRRGVEALRAGASGFLLKDTLPDELLAAVRVVASGEALLAPTVPAAHRAVRAPAAGGARPTTPRSGHAHRPRA